MLRSLLIILAAKAQPPAQATSAAAYVKGARTPLARPLILFIWRCDIGGMVRCHKQERMP